MAPSSLFSYYDTVLTEHIMLYVHINIVALVCSLWQTSVPLKRKRDEFSLVAVDNKVNRTIASSVQSESGIRFKYNETGNL